MSQENHLEDSWLLPQLQPAPLHSQGSEDKIGGREARPDPPPPPFSIQKWVKSLALISTGCNQVKALMLNDISFHYKLQKL